MLLCAPSSKSRISGKVAAFSICASDGQPGTVPDGGGPAGKSLVNVRGGSKGLLFGSNGLSDRNGVAVGLYKPALSQGSPAAPLAAPIKSAVKRSWGSVV